MLKKIAELINTNNEGCRKLKITKKQESYDDIDKINEILHAYSSHAHIHTPESYKNQPLDRIPVIIKEKHNPYTYIKFFPINGSFNDRYEYELKHKKYPNYKHVASKYCKRIRTIVKKTQQAIKRSTCLLLDFTECGGGDFECFADAFKDIIGCN